MIILDTKVVSESLRQRCDASVTAWLDAQVAETLHITSINTAELWAGAALMPAGQRKTALESSLDELLLRLFGDRRLDFYQRAARAYAALVRKTSAAGAPLRLAEGSIAAIASARGFAVATRDAAPFLGAAIEVIDPWKVLSGRTLIH